MDRSDRGGRFFYDRTAGMYDFLQRTACRTRGGERAVRRRLLERLEVSPGDRVLEVSIGTGANLPYLPATAKFVGVDLSRGMLRRCRVRRRGVPLCCALASALPFADDVFDVVFHVGGINFFGDKEAAIREMIRVARPGALLLISDEHVPQPSLATRVFQRVVFGRRDPEGSTPPLSATPTGMAKLEVDLHFGGAAYVVTMRKPMEPFSMERRD